MLAGLTVNSAESKQTHREGDDQESVHSSACVRSAFIWGPNFRNCSRPTARGDGSETGGQMFRLGHTVIKKKTEMTAEGEDITHTMAVGCLQHQQQPERSASPHHAHVQVSPRSFVFVSVSSGPHHYPNLLRPSRWFFLPLLYFRPKHEVCFPSKHRSNQRACQGGTEAPGL